MIHEAPTDALRLVPVSLIADTMTAMARAYERIHSLPRVSDTELAIRTDEAKERLRPYLAAPASPLPEGGGWQDISTAPKDGTEVLVMLKPKVIRLGWYFKPSSRTEGWCDENGKRIIPSHWMPLPAAPTGAK